MRHGPHETVELRPAYVWDCQECGREVFERGVVCEADAESEAEMREEHGIEPWEEGAWIMMPETVACPHCGATFATHHYSDA
ncbi:MAG: hypothetical protein ACOY3P_17880 [Planctomycetota bacterium]